jgi:sec-independent protein translocase protein TatB
MFDIGWSELLVIAVVAIVVVGPKQLPGMMRTFGHYAGRLRRMAAEFQRQFDEAMREAEADEVRQAMEQLRSAPLDLSQPVMRPKPEAGPAALTKPARKRKAPAKAKAKPAKRGKPAARTARPRKDKKS